MSKTGPMVPVMRRHEDYILRKPAISVTAFEGTRAIV